MASETPPYHTPIYLENLSLGQVAEVTPNFYLDTDYVNPAESSQQQWNLDPSEISRNEYFVKLNGDSTHVLESPEKEGDQAYMKIQGDRYVNHGIQVWVLEQLQVGPSMWALKNVKTEMYLYVDNSGGGQPQAHLPIIVRKATPHDQNAQWKINEVSH